VTSIPGRYFDGASSRPRRVEAIAEAEGLRLREADSDIDRLITRGELSFTPATGLGPSRIAFAGGGLCEFDDRPGAAALFAELGFRASAVDRMSARMRHVIAITIAFIAVMAALYVWGVPWAADVTVALLPHQIDDTIGAQTIQTLDGRGFFRASALPVTRRADLVERFHALKMPTVGGKEPPMITLEFRRFRVPNAFALPGGIVVVSDEILMLAPDDDAILTVLAHEAGHVAHRDALHQIVRATFTSLLAAWYFGDVSTAAATVAGGIGALRYSRDAEHDADLYALDTMKMNGLPTKSAAELFRRLETWRPPEAENAKKGKDPKSADAKPPNEQAKADAKSASGKTDDPKGKPRVELPVYLSTHPATDARIRLFETGKVEPGAAD
jgi:Zn-dependent protease with chaperone function